MVPWYSLNDNHIIYLNIFLIEGIEAISKSMNGIFWEMNIQEDNCLYVAHWFVFLEQIDAESMDWRLYFYVSWYIWLLPMSKLDFRFYQIIVITGSQYLFVRIV